MDPIMMFGLSTIGSLVQGWLSKNKTKLPNDTIPMQTASTWGGAGVVVAQQTGDPMMMIAGLGGSFAANVTHKIVFGGIRKLWGMFR